MTTDGTNDMTLHKTRRARRLAALAMVAAAAWPTLAGAQATPLNDTGQTQCFNSSTPAACNAASVRGQDGQYGRDAAAVAGMLPKQGAGEAGFDYTKLCMNGEAAGSGSCAADPVANTDLVPADTAWACTRDNVTDLVWSLHVRVAPWTDAMGAPFADAGHNSITRCGYATGWRLPTVSELESIVNYSHSNPSLDSAHFATTTGGDYWSSTRSSMSGTLAWAVSFSSGSVGRIDIGGSTLTRLVRSGS